MSAHLHCHFSRRRPGVTGSARQEPPKVRVRSSTLCRCNLWERDGTVIQLSHALGAIKDAAHVLQRARPQRPRPLAGSGKRKCHSTCPAPAPRSTKSPWRPSARALPSRASGVSRRPPLTSSPGTWPPSSPRLIKLLAYLVGQPPQTEGPLGGHQRPIVRDGATR
jgi:hypothetical protein